MKKINTLLFICVAFIANAQHIQIQLVNKTIVGNTWCFDVQASALPTYVGADDNWGSMNVRFNLQVPPASLPLVSQMVTAVPTGMTGSAQISVPGSPPSPYNSDFGLLFDRTTIMDLNVNGTPQIWGNVCLTFTGPVMGSTPTQIYDQRDNTGAAGSFYIPLDDATASQRSLSEGVATQLPIKLRKFNVLGSEKPRASILNWTSSSEINGSHFEVERSTDAQSWNKVGIVNAVGNSSTEVDYEFIDRTIDHARGKDVFYYRLNKVDLDGSSEYTDIRTVHFDPVAAVALNVYPTLTTGLVRLDISSPVNTAASAPAVLYDRAGRMVAKQEVSTNGITEIDLAKHSNGNYFIKVDIAEETYTTQIIKTN